MHHMYKEVFGNVRIVGVPDTPPDEQNCVIIAHSMTRKDDMVCTDKICKTKRSKESRSKVSPICQGNSYICSFFRFRRFLVW